jgi:tight adherence protein B
MKTLLFPFFAFAAVMLIMLLVYGVWFHFFDRRNQAKKKRLLAIHNAVHPDKQSLSSMQDSALESWLRLHFRTFEQLETRVQRAHSPFTAVRIMSFMLSLFTVVVVLGLLIQINLLLLLVLAVAITSTPLLWLSRLADQRRKAFEDKLPETLDYISRAMRAGHGLTSAIGMVGKEFADPIGYEFKTVFDEISFGISFKEAIGQLSERVQSNDINFFVISLMIQHETGGNLTELLDGLASTVRERVKLRGKIRTLASEGRASAWVMGSIPFVLAGILSLISPVYMSVLWTTPQGQKLILIGGVLMAVGFFLLNRIVQIKV